MLKHYLLPICFIIMAMLPSNRFAYQWREFQVDNHIIRVEISTSIQEQRLGLGNRTGLADGSGMLFYYRDIRERVMWMKRMRFPIDIIWIRAGKVIHLEKNIPPPSRMMNDAHLKRYGTGKYADQVLELPAGDIDKKGIRIGSKTKLLTH